MNECPDFGTFVHDLSALSTDAGSGRISSRLGVEGVGVLPRLDPSPELLALAEAQAAVLTTEQLVGHGLTRKAVGRLVTQGHWRRLDRGVYLTRPDQPTWLASAWAGVLLGGDAARLGGSAAGFLYGLVQTEPVPITVLVPAYQVTRSRYPWRYQRESDGVRDRRSPGSPPRTTVEDTVLDLCDESTPGQAVGLVTTAVQSRRTAVVHLRHAIQRRQRLRHRLLLEDLLGDVEAGVESPLEHRYLRDVERAHGLPHATRQNTNHSFRRDVVYRRYGVVVELDGRLGHEGAGRFRDMRRDNPTTIGGEVTLRYGHADVAERHCLVAQQVATVLMQRGWTGPLSRCPRCPVGS